MYCPQCGLKNSSNSKYCESCGEDLEPAMKHIKNKQYTQYLIYAIALTVIIGLFSGYLMRYYWIFIILFVLYAVLMFFYGNIKSLFGSETIGEHQSTYCPNCQNSDFNEKYCVKCGYNLDDILVYLRTNKNDIEVNKNYINIYPIRYKDGERRRLDPTSYDIDKIQNIRISSCKSVLSDYKCLIFDYLDKGCNGPFAKKKEDKCVIKAKIDNYGENELDNILSTGVYEKLYNNLDY